MASFVGAPPPLDGALVVGFRLPKRFIHDLLVEPVHTKGWQSPQGCYRDRC
jgi:hypothetical protein